MPAPSASLSAFQDLVQQKVTAVTIDDHDNDPFFLFLSYLIFPMMRGQPFSLNTQHSVKEEFALYELLDLDTEGKDDMDMEFDETTEQG